MDKTGWLAIVGTVLLVFGLSQSNSNPSTLIFLGVMGLVWIAAVIYSNRAKKSKSLQRHSVISSKLKEMSQNFGTIDIPGFAPGKNEKVIYKIDSVGLTEFRSSGSSYSGGSQGVSIRIAQGVNYRVGASKGQLLKNPEVRSIVDTGSAVFTNKRVVFVGQNLNREWEFSKLIGADIGENGVYANLAVSNRQKNSGLQSIDDTDITPGILVSVAFEAFEKDMDSAKTVAVDYANQMGAIAQGAVSRPEGGAK